MTRLPSYVLALLVVVFRCKQALGSSAAGTETLVGVVGADFVMLGADSAVSQSISLTASNYDKIAILVEPFPEGDNRIRKPFCQQTILAAAAGDAADSDRLLGVLKAHAAIREFEAGVGCDVDYRGLDNEETRILYESPSGMSVEEVARMARGQIAGALRSRTPIRVCLLVAGMLYMGQRPSEITDGNDLSTFVSEQVQRQLLKVQTTGSQSEEDDRPADMPNTGLQPRLYWLDEYGSLQKIQYGAHGYGSNFALSILDQGFKKNMSREEAASLIRTCFEQLRLRYIINSPQPPCIKCVDAQGCHVVSV